jgi:apolipoprotein N-acyltransferase
MQKVAQFIATYPRWIALLAGAASATGFAPLNLWPVTLLCFALFIHLVAQAKSGKRAALIGWLFGVGHFTIGNNWIAVAFTFQAAMPIWLGYGAVVVLALYLAVYPALAALGAWWVARILEPPRYGEVAADASASDDGGVTPSRDVSDITGPSNILRVAPLPVPRRYSITLPFILAFAGCWIITEWLRSWVFTGYVWNPLATIAVDSRVIGLMEWFGTYGFGGWIIFLVGALALTVQRWLVDHRYRSLGAALADLLYVALLLFLLGAETRIADDSLSSANSPSITVVQPNRPQDEKNAPGFEDINFGKLARLSPPLAGQGPRLLLWSEDAIPDYLEDGYPYRYYQFQPGGSAAGARARLMTLLGEGDVLVTGANRLVIDKGQLVAARNSVSAMDSTGRLLGHYDKAHLVPYGEYLPMPWLLRPLGLARLVPGSIDFWPGPGPQTMTVSVGGRPVKIGMQICYEIIFSGQVVDRNDRPDFLFNPSNDSWFGTIGPPQFLAQARLRAIEEGLPVVRATPTGISAVIDADGRIVQSVPHRTAGRIDMRLPTAKAPTLFARYGNILPIGFALLLIGGALLPLARRRTSRYGRGTI